LAVHSERIILTFFWQTNKVAVLAVVVALCGLGAVGLFFSLLLSLFRAKYQGYPYRCVLDSVFLCCIPSSIGCRWTWKNCTCL